tara:strand:- start:25540 stop:26595 length:1056 start_codon:yes stop_codon:yes gene_type:complete
VKNKQTLLTVTPFKETSQEGQKSLSLCSSLHKDKSFYCIHKHYSPANAETLNEGIYIQNSFDHGDYDICIENVNPAFITKVAHPTVAFYEPQTENQRAYNTQLCLPDFLAVRSKLQRKVLPKEVRDNAFVVRPNIWMHNRRELIGNIVGDFVFYVPFLGQTSNMDKIITAYYHSFSNNDPVKLAFASQDHETFDKFVSEMQNRLRTHGPDLYPPILTYSSVDEMHSVGNCCIDVCSSYEVQFQTLVAFRACNPSIIMEGSSINEWCPDGFVYRTPSHPDITNMQEPQALELYTGKETCPHPTSLGIAKTMREAFDNRWEFMKKQKCVTLEAPNAFGDEGFLASIREIPCFQ